jgi:glutathione S-transferase
MKLLYSPGSPYARKVRIALREKGLLPMVTEVAVNPHDNGSDLLALNPLGKVPALETSNGLFFDSPLICEYLDSLSSEVILLPRSGPARFAALRLQALADGVMDAAVASVLEQRRTDTTPSKHWLNRWAAVIDRGVDALSQANLPAGLSLGGIAAFCALDYLRFRFPGNRWMQLHPGLLEWTRLYSTRPSAAQTAPPEA